MAISHVGALADATANRTTSTTITLNFATAAGDWIFVVFTNGGANADGSIAGTVVTTGGVSFSKGAGINGGGTTTLTGVLWIGRATGNHNGQTIVCSGATDSCASTVEVLRGCHWTTPILVKSEELNASGENGHAALNASGVSGCWLLLGLSCDDNIASASEAATAPATITERAEHLSSGGVDTASTVCAAAMGGTGSTGAISWTNARGAGLYLVSMAAVIQPRVDATGTPTTVTPTVVPQTLAGGVTEQPDVVTAIATINQLTGGEVTPATGTIITFAGGAPPLPTTALAARWETDSGVFSTGGILDYWADQIGGVHAFPYDPLSVDVDTIGGQPAITFDGIAFLEVGSGGENLFRNLAGATVYFVLRPAASSGDRCLFEWTTGDGSYVTRATGAINSAGNIEGGDRRLDADSAQQFTRDDGMFQDVDKAFAFVFDWANHTAAVYDESDDDGGSLTTSYQTGGSTSDTASNGKRLFNRSLSAARFVGAVSAVFVYQAAHDATQRAAVMAYIGVKYLGVSGSGAPIVANVLGAGLGGAPVTKVVSASPQQPTVSVGGAPVTKMATAFPQALTVSAGGTIQTDVVAVLVQTLLASVTGTLTADVANVVAQILGGGSANPLSPDVVTVFPVQLSAEGTDPNATGTPVTVQAAALAQVLAGGVTEQPDVVAVAVLAQPLTASAAGTVAPVLPVVFSQQLAGGITVTVAADLVTVVAQALTAHVGGAPVTAVVAAVLQALAGSSADPLTTGVATVAPQTLTASGAGALTAVQVTAVLEALQGGSANPLTAVQIIAIAEVLSAAVNATGTPVTDVVTAVSEILTATAGATGNPATVQAVVSPQTLGGGVSAVPTSVIVLAASEGLSGSAGGTLQPDVATAVVEQLLGGVSGLIGADPVVVFPSTLTGDSANPLQTVQVTATANLLAGGSSAAATPATVQVDVTPQAFTASASGTLAADVVTVVSQQLQVGTAGEVLSATVDALTQALHGGSADPIGAVPVTVTAEVLSATADVTATAGTVQVSVHVEPLTGSASGVLIPDVVLVTVAQLLAVAAAAFVPGGGVTVTVTGPGGVSVTVAGVRPRRPVTVSEEGGGTVGVEPVRQGETGVARRSGVTTWIE